MSPEPITIPTNGLGLQRVSAACLTAGAILAAAFPAAAQDSQPVTFWKSLEEKTALEWIWAKTRLFEDQENPVIQAFSIVGRYQGQYWSVNADQGNADGWENRRICLGGEVLLLRQITVQAQIRISEDFAPFYDGLYQAFVKWSPGEAFSLSAGRVDFGFNGLERSISSTKIATIERGQLVNQLMPAEVVGTVAEANAGGFSCRAGVSSGSVDQEFTDFRGGVGVFGGVGYQLPLFYQTGSLHVDYLFNDGNPANNALKPYDHVVSLWHQGQAGPFALGVNLTWANGLDARPAVFGVTLLPTYVFAKNVLRRGDALQAVLRYQFALSDGDNGLELQRRYEQDVVSGGYGDRYQAVYAGVNYLLFGDRFKLMTGAEYAAMHDSAGDGGAFNGWTYLAGVRVYF